MFLYHFLYVSYLFLNSFSTLSRLPPEDAVLFEYIKSNTPLVTYDPRDRSLSIGSLDPDATARMAAAVEETDNKAKLLARITNEILPAVVPYDYEGAKVGGLWGLNMGIEYGLNMGSEWEVNGIVVMGIVTVVDDEN